MAKKTELNFAASFAELEKIAEWFEGGSVDLDKALPMFERGLELASSCKKKLDEISNKVEEIKKKFATDYDADSPLGD